MWTASVEADMGEKLIVKDYNGNIYGKTLLSFQTTLSLYCLGEANETELDWFDTLSKFTDHDLCLNSNVLIDAIYSGNWDYEEHEYDLVRERLKDNLQLTKEAFIAGINSANRAWTDCNQIIRSLVVLISGLSNMPERETSWFVPKQTILALETLLDTIILLRYRGNTKVRINIQ